MRRWRVSRIAFSARSHENDRVAAGLSRRRLLGLAFAALPAGAPPVTVRDDSFARWWETFRSPPREYTLIPFWFWNDDLDEKEIVRQMDDFAAHGVHGVVVHPRLGLPETIAFMSDRYLRFVRVAVEHAAKRGMIVHLYDEGMYPSGAAGGRVVRENPALAARCLLWREVTGEKEAPLEPGENLVTQATRADGRRIALIDAPSRGRIRGVHFGQDDGEPNQPFAADLLNPEATQSFLRHVHERYFAAVGKHFGRTIRAIFTDEPDLLGRRHRRDARPWTTGLETVLREKLGYDPLPRLPELWFGDGEETGSFRRDFRRAVQERLEETYYKPLSDWCAAQGVALTGHPAGPGDIGVLRRFQIPGQDIVWRYIEPGKPSALEGDQSVVGKCGSSAALHLGRARNGNEALGAYGWNLTFAEMEWLTDWLLVRGVNLIWPHAFYYSIRGPRRDERPPDVGPNNTWWERYRPYADYARRLCWLNAAAQHRAQIAILGWPDYLPWRAAKVCFQHQRDFNYLETRHLQDGSARVTAEGIRIGPMRYRALIVDEPARLETEVAGALEPLIEAGRLALFGGRALAGVPAFEDADALAQWLGRIAPPELVLTPPSPDLRCRPLTQGDQDIFLLFNEGEKPLQGTVTLPETDGDRWVIDPRSLSRSPAPPGEPVRLELRPHQTLLIVQRRRT